MFDDFNYFVSLTMRAGEFAAYENCSEEVKDATLLLATLTRYGATESFVESAAALITALGGRRAIVSFDPAPRTTTSLAEAAERRRRKNLVRAASGAKESQRSEKQLANDAEQLRKTEAFNANLSTLTDPQNGPFRWIDLVGNFPELVPTLRLINADMLRRQIDHVASLDRSAALRVRLDEPIETGMALECARSIAEGAGSLVLILDAGNIWKNEDRIATLATNVLRRLRTECGAAFNELTKVSVSTSFPKQPLRSVSSELPISDIAFHQRIMSEFGVRYGDYGSLPNRTEDTLARGWFPHVDLVTLDQWIFSLFEENRATKKYVDAAKIIVGKPEWKQKAECWGSAIIEQVSGGTQIIDGKSFTHPSPWLTVRVNQHISQMALRR